MNKAVQLAAGLISISLNIPMDTFRIRCGMVHFIQDPGGIFMLCRKCLFQGRLIFLRNLHGMQGHMHVILGDEYNAAFCRELSFEAIA